MSSGLEGDNLLRFGFVIFLSLGSCAGVEGRFMEVHELEPELEWKLTSVTPELVGVVQKGSNVVGRIRLRQEFEEWATTRNEVLRPAMLRKRFRDQEWSQPESPGFWDGIDAASGVLTFGLTELVDLEEEYEVTAWDRDVVAGSANPTGQVRREVKPGVGWTVQWAMTFGELQRDGSVLSDDVGNWTVSLAGNEALMNDNIDLVSSSVMSVVAYPPKGSSPWNSENQLAQEFEVDFMKVLESIRASGGSPFPITGSH